MPTYFARKAGNINASDVWATAPSGTAAAVTFASGDVLIANSFAIAVNVSTDLGATGQVRNDTTGGATTGGNFTLANGVTLTANIFASGALTQCVILTGSNSANIVGNFSSVGGFNNQAAAVNSGSGILNVTGNANGTSAASNSPTINNTSLGTINFSGNLTGGSGTGAAIGNTSGSTGAISITGIVTGGSASPGALNSSSTATITINGTAVGGSGFAGAVNGNNSNMLVTRACGNAYGPGNTAGLTAQVGVSNTGLGIVEIEQLEYGTNGMSPTSGTGIRLKKLSSNVAVFNYCNTAGAKTLIDATQNAAMPAATDVRSGVSYASGAQTGSCAVPAAGSVALGVPVDNTTGTAVLTPAAVWGHASRTLTTSSGPTAVEIRQELDSNSTKLANLDTTVSSRLAPSGTLATVTTLTNAPTVPTPSQIASQVRTELSTELARVDAAISSRLAGSAYTAPANSDVAAIKAKTDNLPASPAATGDIPSANISAIKAKTDLLNTDRLGQCSTVATTGAQLAAALS